VGTRTQGNAGRYSGKRETSKSVSALKQALEAHKDSKTLAKMAIKTIAVSNPMIAEIVLGTELAYSAYKGLKTYEETKDIKQALISAGIDSAKTLASGVIFPIGIKTASDLIVPGLVAKFAGNAVNSGKIRDDTKIIKSAIEVAAGVLT
jgi:hypothetical protein